MSTQIRIRPNRWGRLALMLLVLTAAVVLTILPLPVQAQGNIKSDFLAVVRQRMDETNRGSGLSSQFFSVGDPNKMLPKVDSYLNGVAVDPKYLSSYKWKQVTGFDRGTEGGLTQPRGWSQTWTNVVTPQEGRYDGWVILAEAPATNDEIRKTAFHEAIHAYHLAIDAGGVDEDAYEGPETISNSFSNVVFVLRNLDSMISHVFETIRKGQEYELELKVIRKRMADQKATITGYTSQFHTCLRNIGGKADFAGYEQEFERRVKKAIEQAEKLNMGRNRELVLVAKPTVTEQKGGSRANFLLHLQYRVNGLDDTETALVDAIVSLDGPSRLDIPVRTKKVKATDLKVEDIWAFSDLKPGDYTARYLLNWPSNGQVSGTVSFKVVGKQANASGTFKQTGVVEGKLPSNFENDNVKITGSMNLSSVSITEEKKPPYVGKGTVTIAWKGTPKPTLKPGDILELSCTSKVTRSGVDAPNTWGSCAWGVEGSIKVLEDGKCFAGMASSGQFYPACEAKFKFRVLPGQAAATIIIRAMRGGGYWGNGDAGWIPAEYKYKFNP
jgi:hypothetical protein